MSYSFDMYFCRRCGSPFTSNTAHVYTCKQGHIIFANASPSIGVILLNSKNEILLAERGIDPGKGLFDLPGGFCDGMETLEDAVTRELSEELGLTLNDYSDLQYVLSGKEHYHFKGEDLPVLSVVFSARLKRNETPQGFDDVASTQFYTFAELDHNKVYFNSHKEAIRLLQQTP